MYSVEELFLLINRCQHFSSELKKCSAFNKLTFTNQFGELVSVCHTIDDQLILEKELQHLIEESERDPKKIPLTSFTVNKNKIYLKLDRLNSVKSVFIDLFECQTTYGCSNMFCNKVLRICYGENHNELTELRMRTAGYVMSNLIALGGGSVTDNADAETVYISSSPGSSILVGPVHIAGSTDTSETNYIQLRETELQMSDHKELSDQSVEQLIHATVVFDLLSIKLSKSLVLNSSDVPSSSRRHNCRGAAFVLYNYARVCAILDRFEDMVSKGVYKPLPSFHDIDYNLLTKEEEWRLVFDFLAEWPAVIAECQDLSQPKLYKMVAFLSSLASTFSVFYKYNRVLNEGLDHMVPLMEARIHLLKAIKTVFSIAFSLLKINPLTKM